jgi:transcriptional regulator with XRE-family HTH domain
MRLIVRIMPAAEIGPAGQQVAENVKLLRQRRGLSLRQLSELLARHDRPILASGLAKLEAGDRRIDVDDLTVIAAVLGSTPMRLLRNTDPDKPLTARDYLTHREDFEVATEALARILAEGVDQVPAATHIINEAITRAALRASSGGDDGR